MKTDRTFIKLTMTLLVAGLVGCGGGTDGSGSATGNRVVGVVNSVGGNEVTVSNSTFSTSSASISGDEIASVDEIQPGMIVSIDANSSGDAEDIDYDAEVEGIVDSIGAGTMVVMGQSVDISQNPTFVSEMDGVTDINNIPAGAMVEVSGYSDGMGNIVATFVKLEDHMADENDAMELEGIITSLDMVAGTFMIGDQIIYFDPNTVELMLENGLNVEVYIEMATNGDLHAVEIEIEHDYSEEENEGHEVEIEGMVTSDLGLDGTFTINGELVMLGDNVEYQAGLSQDSIINGALLEVEGRLDENGMLVITDIGTHSSNESDHDIIVI